MSDPTRLTPDEIQELLALRATEGLDTESQRIFDALVEADPALADEANAYEQAAAAADVAMLNRAGVSGVFPGGLRDQVTGQAGEHVRPTVEPNLRIAGSAADVPTPAARQSLLSPAMLGWAAAAAAMIALVFVLAQPPRTEVQVVEVRVPVETDPAEPPLNEQYAQLADTEGTVAAQWGYNAADGEERFKDATGEIIFNADTQTGYMKLAGLPVNDPTKEQYQLWIVDATRGEENTNRIDGGVFNVSAEGEVIIPVTAKLNARQPIVFAITVETPGGVVESKGPLHVVAAVASE